MGLILSLVLLPLKIAMGITTLIFFRNSDTNELSVKHMKIYVDLQLSKA